MKIDWGGFDGRLPTPWDFLLVAQVERVATARWLDVLHHGLVLVVAELQVGVVRLVSLAPIIDAVDIDVSSQGRRVVRFADLEESQGLLPFSGDYPGWS